jgi:6-phosphogluconolactonase
MIVYVGAYTGPGKAQGISVFRLDAAAGALSHLQTVEGVDNPSFLALDPQQRFLYAANEAGGAGGGPAPEGAVSAFAVDAQDGTLTPLNRQPSGGVSPCYVHVEPEGRYLLVANYTSGHVAVFPRRPDGSLDPASHVVHHEGLGPTPRRQAGAHAHSITTDPAGRLVLSCDLGVDKIFVYRLDREAGRLVPNDVPYGQASSGAGPRHVAFHPNGRFAFVNNEIDSTLSAFAYDAERGTLRIVDTASTLPSDFAGNNSTAQVLVHPNGRFAYVSNRGHDSIAIFAVNPETGKLRALGHEPTQGKTPRNFNLDPSGVLLLAANQGSDTIVSFRVDAQSGQLTATGQVTQTPAPVAVLFG